MPGILDVGVSRSGKSYWLKKFAIPYFRGRGHPVSVLCPFFGGLAPHLSQRVFGADWVTNKVDHFIKACELSSRSVWVVEEASRWNFKQIEALEYIFTGSGNFGNLGIITAQRLMMIPPNIRNMADCAVIFNQTAKDLDDLAERLNQPKIMEAMHFPKGMYMYVQPFTEPSVYMMFSDPNWSVAQYSALIDRLRGLGMIKDRKNIKGSQLLLDGGQSKIEKKP